jgi:glucose-1-phosphatase
MPGGDPTTILFDLGGTVCRFDPGPRLAALAADCGLRPGEVHARVWDAGLTRDFDEGRYTSGEWYALVRDRLGLRMDAARFADVMLGALSEDAAMLALVDALRPRHRTALLTDNPPLLLEQLATRLPGVAARFDPLLFSCELRAMKPSRAIFERALVLLAEPAGRVLFIDDVPANVDAARAIGMDAIHFTGASALRAQLAARGLLAPA